jgi:hypothetical protein
MKRLLLLTLFSCSLSVVIFYFTNETTTIASKNGTIPKSWLIKNQKPYISRKEVRAGYVTYLSYPEWHLVYCPEEQASYFKRRTSSTFPFMEQSDQIWEGYKIMNDQVKDSYKVDFSYHLMIWVIGISSSLEYSIKAWYETVIGRVTDTHYVLTEEDTFNEKFTQDYVAFIKDRPWYEYDFKAQLKSLWTNTSFFGNHFFRKLDRKYILTSELLFKYVYGKLITVGSNSIYGISKETTPVVLENLPAAISMKDIDSVYADKSVLMHLPRYDKFNNAAVELIKKGGHFKEIGGNTSSILLTILADSSSKKHYPNTKEIFTQLIPSNAKQKRIALATMVSNLDELITALVKDKITIEHIYDY